MSIERVRNQAQILPGCNTVDWKTAATEFARKKHGLVGVEFVNKFWLNDIADDFQFLVPVTPESKILVIGGPIGEGMMNLAERAQSITIMESRQEIQNIIEMMIEQFSIHNLYVTNQTLSQTPKQNELMDLIVQEMPFTNSSCPQLDRPMLSMDENHLTMVQNNLKTGGYYYLSFENVYSPMAILKNLQSKNSIQKKTNASYFKIKKLLAQHGFKVVRSFYLLPNHRRFSFAVEGENRGSFSLLAKLLKPYPQFNRMKAMGISSFEFMPFKIERIIWPGFGVLAQKI